MRKSYRKWIVWPVLSAVAACSGQQTRGAERPDPDTSDDLLQAPPGDGGATSSVLNKAPESAEPVDDPSATPESTGETHPADPTTGLVLRVVERGRDRPWKLRVFNAGTKTVRLVADPRLLWFDVQVPGKKKPAVCRLPSELSPTRVDQRLVVELEPGEGVADRIDPRLYCFDAGSQKLLVAGALVEPHLGWAEAPPKRVWRKGRLEKIPVEQRPPFVATVVQESAAAQAEPSPKLAVKQLGAPPFALRSEYAAWSSSRLKQEEPTTPAEEPLVLRLVQGSDAAAERSATIRLQLLNRSKRTLQVFFRRELVTFEVVSDQGTTTCNAEPDDRAPDPLSFLSLAPGKPMAITCQLAELCPQGTFAHPGLYLVHARFDAMDDGSAHRIEAFTGTAASREPAMVRIRTGDMPFLTKRPMRRFKRRRHSSLD